MAFPWQNWTCSFHAPAPRSLCSASSGPVACVWWRWCPCPPCLFCSSGSSGISCSLPPDCSRNLRAASHSGDLGSNISAVALTYISKSWVSRESFHQHTFWGAALPICSSWADGVRPHSGPLGPSRVQSLAPQWMQLRPRAHCSPPRGSSWCGWGGGALRFPSPGLPQSTVCLSPT